MFQWLRRLLNPPPVNLQISIHIDGELKVKHEAGSGMPIVPLQGPLNSPTPIQDTKGDAGDPRRTEVDIGPEFFSDTTTPGASFGRDIELPSGREKKDDTQVP